MRKLYSLLTGCLLLFFQTIYAQTNIASYHLSTSSGTYTPISGGTVFLTSWDNNVSGAIPLGGTFTFGGSSFTTCYISSNGFITFGAAPGTATYTALSTLGSTTGAIAAFSQDGASSTAAGAAPEISYENIGGATGEFVVQFKDHANYFGRSTERLNFQIRLDLATGAINIVYGPSTVPGSATSGTTVQVGIRGNSTTYATNVNNLMLPNVPTGTSCNWSNATTGTSNTSSILFSTANPNMSIPTGLTYTWTPQSTVAPVRTFSAVSGITSSGATISWTAPANATGYNVQYRKTGDCSWTNFPAVTNPTVDLSGLLPATSYQVRVQSVAGSDMAQWSHIPNQAGTGDGYVAAGTFTTAGITQDLQALQLVRPVTNSLGCYINEIVIVRIKNAGTDPIDFSTNNATVSASVTGINPVNFTPVVINTGTLAPGATMDVEVASTYNMVAEGSYVFNASVVMDTPDLNPANNALSPVSFNTSAQASLPQYVNFTGYTGTNASISSLFPGWREGSGAVTPSFGGEGSFTNTTSAAQLAHFGAAAKINLYSTNVGWIISPKFTPVAGHRFKYKAAVVNYATDVAADFGPNDTVKILISNDCGATWITLREFTAANNHGVDASSNQLRLFEEDLTTYAGQQLMAAIYARRSPSSFSPDLDFVVDDVAIDFITTCFEPSDLAISNVTTTTAELNWQMPASGTPVDFQIYYSTSSTMPTAGTTPTTSAVLNAPHSLTALTPGSNYYLWVRSNCGTTDGVSVWAGPVSFTTLCAPVTSFAENFGGVTAPALPACWAKVGVGGSASTQTADALSTPNTLYIYSGSTTSLAVVSMPPVSNVMNGTHRLVFKARANFTAGGIIEIGYLTDPSDAATFNMIDQKTIGSLMYEEYVVLPGPLAGVEVLAFRHTGSPAYSVLIDDVRWEQIPSCDVPTGIMVSNITTTDAQVEWTSPTIGAATGYDIYYSTSNNAPVAGTTPTVAAVPGNSTTITNLTPNSTYYLWIRSDCGVDGTSMWSIMTTFRTACAATNVPYSINFESATVPGLPECTSRENAGTGNNWVTILNPGSGFTSTTLQYGYNTTNAADAWFFTQGLNLTGGTSYRITFRYGNNSTTYTEKLEVKYGNSPNSMSMTDFIVDHSSINSASANTSVTDFTPGMTGTYYIGFHAYSDADNWNLYVDDISVVVTPTCEIPTDVVVSNIDQSSAEVTWNAPTATPVTSYDVYYSSNNTPPTSSTTPSSSGIFTNMVNLTGLMANTQYYVWIRSFCNVGDTSVWTAATSFTTLCNATNVPYTLDFEDASVPGLPPCTSRENPGTGNNWITSSNPGSTFTTNTLQYSYNTTNAADAWFFTQGINLTGGTSYRLTFKYGNNSTSFSENLEVRYGSAATHTAMTDLIVDHQNISIAGSAMSVTDFVPGVSGVYYFGFHAYSAANEWNLFVDDISINVSPTCSEPTGLVASAVTANSFQLDWSAPTVGAASSYELYYNTSNVPPVSTTTPTTAAIPAPNTMVTNLSPATTYYVWVRAICNMTDTSTWSAMLPVVTPCVTVDSFFYNFDGGGSVTALPNCWSKVGSGGLANLQSTSAYSGSNTLYIYSTSTTSLAVVAMPAVSNLGNGTHELRFMGRANFTAGGILEVGYLTDPTDASTFYSLQQFTMNSNTTYEPFTFDPGPQPGMQVLAFRAGPTPSYSMLIDDVRWTSKVPVPVKLVSFTGEKNGAINTLRWITSTEVNNRGFELQRSADGNNFGTIAFVASKAEGGNSTATHQYSFDDIRPLAGNGYYRLKQVDKDGRFEYSSVVLIKGDKMNGITIGNIYPNPVKATLNMIVSSPGAEKVSLVVTDITGKVVLQKPVQLMAGDNQLLLPVHPLASGTYMVKAVCAKGCELAVEKFVKQ